MDHYLVENKTLGDLRTAFPHTPNDERLSFHEYIEDKLANGWRVHSTAFDTAGFWFIFIPDAR